jgi:ribonuclease VapC
MVVDTSAILAIIFDEQDADLFLGKLAKAKSRQASVVSYVEASMLMISQRGTGAEDELNLMLSEADITIAPVDLNQAKLASAAFRKYGKGRHPAALNFGDCFSYALAKSCAEPLLFKGFDFVKTDILVA